MRARWIGNAPGAAHRCPWGTHVLAPPPVPANFIVLACVFDHTPSQRTKPCVTLVSLPARRSGEGRGLQQRSMAQRCWVDAWVRLQMAVLSGCRRRTRSVIRGCRCARPHLPPASQRRLPGRRPWQRCSRSHANAACRGPLVAAPPAPRASAARPPHPATPGTVARGVSPARAHDHPQTCMSSGSLTPRPPLPPPAPITRPHLLVGQHQQRCPR